VIVPAPTHLAQRPSDAWYDEVVPPLPPDLAAQTTALGAIQRVRKIATPTDRPWVLLAFALDGHSEAD
jgi:hypothetical protein